VVETEEEGQTGEEEDVAAGYRREAPEGKADKVKSCETGVRSQMYYHFTWVRAECVNCRLFKIETVDR
jgi:hypothetical protein